MAAFLIVWLNAAAGPIGIEDDDPANLLYVGCSRLDSLVQASRASSLVGAALHAQQMASPSIASWNRVQGWLQDMDRLRRAANA